MQPNYSHMDMSSPDPHSIRLMRKQNMFTLEWRWAPKPCLLRIQQSGLLFSRGDEPQDDSVLGGRATVDLPWVDIVAIKYNAWWSSGIRICLHADTPFAPEVWVQWLGDSRYKPYNAFKTKGVFEAIQVAFAGTRSEAR